MKALKIIGIILGVIAAAGFIFWFTMVRAPSVEDACAHVQELLKQDSEKAQLASVFKMDECKENFAKGPREGAFPYAKKMKCVMAAQSFDAIEDCD